MAQELKQEKKAVYVYNNSKTNCWVRIKCQRSQITEKSFSQSSETGLNVTVADKGGVGLTAKQSTSGSTKWSFALFVDDGFVLIEKGQGEVFDVEGDTRYIGVVVQSDDGPQSIKSNWATTGTEFIFQDNKFQTNNHNEIPGRVILKCCASYDRYFQVKDKKWVYLTNDRKQASEFKIVPIPKKNQVIIQWVEDSTMYLNYKNITGCVKVYDAEMRWRIERGSVAYHVANNAEIRMEALQDNQYLGYWKDKGSTELYVRDTFKKEESQNSKFKIEYLSK